MSDASRIRQNLAELAARLSHFPEARIPGTPRRWAQRTPTAAEVERRAALARAERADRALNLMLGISALGAAPAPVRLDVVDADLHIAAALAEIESAVCEWLEITPLGGASSADRVERLDGLADRIVEFDELARWVESETYRLARLAARVLGDVEEIRQIDARCPRCASKSLKAFLEREVVVCINPECIDETGRRHVWPLDRWAELAEVA